MAKKRSAIDTRYGPATPMRAAETHDRPTVHSRDGYTIRSVAQEDAYQNAFLRLMDELNKGLRSGEEEGWVEEATVRALFRRRAMDDGSRRG